MPDHPPADPAPPDRDAEIDHDAQAARDAPPDLNAQAARDAEVDRRLDTIRARLPAPHDPAQLADLRARIAEAHAAAAALRAVPLANGDAPAGPTLPDRTT